MQYDISLPQGWTMDLASIKNPVEACRSLSRSRSVSTGRNILFLIAVFA